MLCIARNKLNVIGTTRKNFKIGTITPMMIPILDPFFKRTTRTDKYGYTRRYKVYQANEYGDPEKYYWSRAPKDHPRQISVNENWQQQKETIRQQLSSPEGGAIFVKRKIEDEPVFGNLIL